MQIIVHYPTQNEGENELENRVADFHATLLIETLKQLNISDKSKKELFNSILEHLNSQKK